MALHRLRPTPHPRNRNALISSAMIVSSLYIYLEKIFCGRSQEQLNSRDERRRSRTILPSGQEFFRKIRHLAFARRSCR